MYLGQVEYLEIVPGGSDGVNACPLVIFDMIVAVLDNGQGIDEGLRVVCFPAHRGKRAGKNTNRGKDSDPPFVENDIFICDALAQGEVICERQKEEYHAGGDENIRGIMYGVSEKKNTCDNRKPVPKREYRDPFCVAKEFIAVGQSDALVDNTGKHRVF